MLIFFFALFRFFTSLLLDEGQQSHTHTAMESTLCLLSRSLPGYD